MTEAKTKVARWPARRLLVRVGAFLLAAAVVASVLGRVSAALDRQPPPAGFGRGVLQGILMPMALPNLLVGRDVTIYSAHNTGVGYKLGYTAGVNACGAVFFGWLFWRLRRLGRGLSQRPPSG